MYLALKTTHTIFAILTLSGFLLRGYWRLQDSPLSRHRITRVAPHVIDTLFLATGIALILEINLPILQTTWLLAKLAGLVLYIGLGMVTMRFGRTPEIRMLAFIGAVATFLYVVGVALAKSPCSWLSHLC